MKVDKLLSTSSHILLSNATTFLVSREHKYSVQMKSMSSQIKYQTYLGIHRMVFEKPEKSHVKQKITSFRTDRISHVDPVFPTKGQEL